MRKIIKKIIPFAVRQRAKGWFYTLKFRKRDNYRTRLALEYSNTFNNDREACLAGLLVKSHVLEKGITMPQRRLGFGYDRVRDLISNCNVAIKRYGSDSFELQTALVDLKQYLDIHVEDGYQLPNDIEDGITKLLPSLRIADENCYSITKEVFFKEKSDYKQFAESRHSVRWFSSEPVDKELLLRAIELAQAAPSACNRQSVRVKIIDSPDKKKVCESLQNGNRGFGQYADKWILITAELGAWSYRDVNSAYIDAGIYAMSLLNALHYYGIIACPLNAHLDAEQLNELQKEIGYPESEIPMLFVVIGNPPDEFMVAKSRRKDVKDLISFV